MPFARISHMLIFCLLVDTQILILELSVKKKINSISLHKNLLQKALRKIFDYVKNEILLYLDCGDLHYRFSRVKCKGCGHEYILAFSCKRRQFCPSCAA
jgi:ribosomal protein S27E